LLQIQEDELIHSFIYRTHKINGISKLSNIVSASGQWQNSPGILPSTIDLYYPIDEQKILKMLQDIEFIKTPKRLFEFPFNYRIVFRDFFNGTRLNGENSKEQSQEITFCQYCIQEQLKNIGFAYFKSSWYGKSYCKLHASTLLTLKRASRHVAINTLENILRGNIPENAVSVSTFSRKENDGKEHHDNKKQKNYAYCFINELNKLSPWKSDSLGGCSIISSSNLTLLEDNYMYLNNIHKKTLTKRLLKKSLEIDVYLGVFDRKSLSEKVTKLKSADCQRCKIYNCPGNLVISPPIKKEELLERCTNNQFSLLDAVGASKKYRHDKENEKIAKMSLIEKSKIINSNKFERVNKKKLLIDTVKYNYPFADFIYDE
jgi:hypothetical protein